VALTVVPVLFVMTHRFSKRVLEGLAQGQGARELRRDRDPGSAGALRVVKAFGQERREENRFVERAGREVRANVRVVRAQSVFYAGIAVVLARRHGRRVVSGRSPLFEPERSPSASSRW
jgi:ABC-type multidrug transport system fused ATPase/permease subunit